MVSFFLNKEFLVLCAISIVFLFLLYKFKPVKERTNQIIHWHSHKNGTSTIGGAFLIVPLIFWFLNAEKVLETVFVFVNAIIFFVYGLVDDLVKYYKGEGIPSSKSRIFCVIVLVIEIILLHFNGFIFSQPGLLTVPYVVFLGILAVYLASILGAVDISDGVDLGVAPSFFLIFFLFMFLFPLFSSLCLYLLAFLLPYAVFNGFGLIFGGNVFSFCLGAVFFSILTIKNVPFYSFCFGLLFWVNFFMVLIQIISFRIFKKRVFPFGLLHHALEVKNVKWIFIVLINFVITILGCLIGIITL